MKMLLLATFALAAATLTAAPQGVKNPRVEYPREHSTAANPTAEAHAKPDTKAPKKSAKDAKETKYTKDPKGHRIPKK